MSERPQPGAAAESGFPNGGTACLRRIADALGCPVGDLFGVSTARPDLAGASELLDLWSAIPDEAGRARLLACAREVAESDRDWAAAAG